MRKQILFIQGFTGVALVLFGMAADLLWLRLAAKPFSLLAMILWI